MRDPHEGEVTTQTVSGLLSDVLLHEYKEQDLYWTDLKRNLQEASAALPDGSELKALVDTIAQAGERSGLFSAVDNLFGGDKSRA